MLAIGLMSGTSLDGIDAALVAIEEGNFHLVKFITLPYSRSFKEIIMRNLNDETAKLSEISSLNFKLGEKFVEAIDLLLDKTSYQYRDISFVASHGQTIWHDPSGIKSSLNTPSTLQIGEASVISYQTGIKTIANFRAMDIVAGGEGAPLVPFSEYLLFRKADKNIVLQNIGGISNLTYLPKNCLRSEVISFDTGPGNIMIDYFVNKYFQLPYDKDGKIAFCGKVIPEVFEYLKKDPFLTRKPPKSTGREQYSQKFMENMATELSFEKYNQADIITTISEYTAYAISYHYLHFLKDIDIAIINGGGAHNKYICSRLQILTKIKIITGEEYGINSDAKEALAFVVLGYQTLNSKVGNLCSATGAKEEVILGTVTFNPHEHKNE